MFEPAFKAFSKIDKFNTPGMMITQKIHGTNAVFCIYKDENNELKIKAGSRSRWLSIGDDNFGFCKFIMDNAQEFIEKFEEGYHYGEWAGPGINSGEGLTEKTLVLFCPGRYSRIEQLPKNVMIVPVLEYTRFSEQTIKETFDKLKNTGSQLVPGFMRPEGIVIETFGNRYKMVFSPEETGWTKGEKEKQSRIDSLTDIDIDYLLQPIRLEKLLSRDERYLRSYPESLRDICSDYTKDLIEENQIQSETEDEKKVILKALGRKIFKFIKMEIEKNGIIRL